jgi:hypothetical protein
MQYQVIQQGRVIGKFRYFFEAWLYVYLELPCFARIKGPDGTWHVNPHNVN